MKLIYTLLLIVLIPCIVGCEKEIQYVDINHTFTEVINNTVECVKPECICKCDVPECKTVICDDTLLSKCRMDNARVTAQLNYYKNLSISNIIRNDTIEDIEENLTNCLEDKIDLEDKLEEIKKSLE